MIEYPKHEYLTDSTCQEAVFSTGPKTKCVKHREMVGELPRAELRLHAMIYVGSHANIVQRSKI